LLYSERAAFGLCTLGAPEQHKAIALGMAQVFGEQGGD